MARPDGVNAVIITGVSEMYDEWNLLELSGRYRGGQQKMASESGIKMEIALGTRTDRKGA